MSAPLAENFLKPQNLWKPLAIIAALAFAYAAVLNKLGRDWWDDPNYSHGLLIPFIIGFILWADRERLMRVVKRPSPLWGGAGVACALLALWAGTAGAELFVQRMSLVLMIAGIVVYFWGFKTLRLALVPLLLLVLAIPIPAIVFNQIAFPLQLFASRCAVWAMRMFDIPVLRDGNIIELMPLNSTTTKKLAVVEACSGIRSLMTLMTLAVVLAYFTYPRPKGGDGGETKFFGFLSEWGFWRSVIIVLSAVPIAIFTNALRVSGTGVLSRYYGTEIADGFFHTFSGWVLYIVSFVLLFTVGWLLDRASGRSRRRGGKGGGSKATSPETETTDAPAKTAATVRPTAATALSNQASTGAIRLEGAENKY